MEQNRTKILTDAPRSKDPYQKQRSMGKKNREIILRKLGWKSMTFKELTSELDLSKPVLSEHLKGLKKQGYVIKTVENDKVVYKLTEQAFKAPTLRILYFEVFAYRQMLRELFKMGEPIRGSVGEEKISKRESMLYWDLSSKDLKRKSESELAKAFDKWLSPIILYSIVQELKGKIKWTEAVQGIVNKIISLVKQKDIGKFEEALKTLYSERPDADRMSVMESLDWIVKQVEKEKMIDDYFNEVFRKIESLGE